MFPIRRLALVLALLVCPSAPSESHAGSPLSVPRAERPGPPRPLEPDALDALLCKSPSPSPASAPLQGLADSAKATPEREPIDGLAEEMEKYMTCEFFPFVIDPKAVAEAKRHGAECPNAEAPGFRFQLPPEAGRRFSAYFGIEPCHPDILMSAVGKLRDAWLNKGDLRSYFNALSPLLETWEREKDPKVRAAAGKMRAKLEEFLSRAKAAMPMEDSPEPSPSAPSPETLIACLRPKLRAAGIPVEGQQDDSALLYYALFRGNRRLAGPGFETSLRTWAKGCAPSQRTECVLQALGYQAPSRIVSLYHSHHVAFLGYPERDLDFIASLWSHYAILRRGMHGALAMLNPDEPGQMINQWEDRERSVTMWGSEYLHWQERQLTGKPNRTQALDRLRKERVYVFLHEMAHAVDTKLMSTDQPGGARPLGEKWDRLSWREAGGSGEWKPRAAPFSCGGIRFQRGSHYGPADQVAQRFGFVTQYGSTNPAEDFAESLATYLTDPNTLRAVSPQKLAFIERLLEVSP